MGRKKTSKHLKRLQKTKRKTRDIDEVDVDLQPENFHKLLHQEVDIDKPGDAQHYCVHCARYFITREALIGHFRSKLHKKRLKDLELEPYSIEESRRASGMGSYYPAKKRKIETQPIDDGTYDPDKEDVDMDDEKPKVKRIKTEESESSD